MKKKYAYIMCLIILCFICTNQVFASRAYAPVILSPIRYKDIKISAENSSAENMGIVQAFNINTNKLMWKKKIYNVKINPGVEEDTQLIFIKEIKIDKDKIVVINENNKIFKVNPNTGRVLNRTNTLVITILVFIVISSLLISLIYIYRNRKNI